MLRPVASADDLVRLAPLDRFRALIDGENFAPRFRAEPLVFDIDDPIYGYGCGVEGCRGHVTRITGWCTPHGLERRDALRAGTGEAAWRAGVVALADRARPAPHGRRPACRFCPDRDARRDGLCLRHSASRRRALGIAGDGWDEPAWAARQDRLPGAGACAVEACAGRAELTPSLCPAHRIAWRRVGCPDGAEWERWQAVVRDCLSPGAVTLVGLPPLLEAEIRYGLWVHTKSRAPARWFPMCLRTLVRSCLSAGAASLLDLDPDDGGWTPQPAAVNRIVREMLKDVEAVHYSRADTRRLGYIDTNYWGFRFADRRSPFDLSAITQPWLRDLAWDYLAAALDGPRRPRRAGTFEQARRSLVCLSAYLSDRDPCRGERPNTLSEATARGGLSHF